MLENRRIPLNIAERDAVDKLLGEHPGKVAAFTRRDPGNTGPVLLEVAGVGTWVIDEDGHRRKTDG